MAFTLPGEGNPVYETWVMLLNGYGYNWYRKDNQLRADDLLVREHACQFIVGAAAQLQEQEAGYSRAYLPPPSRAQPLPPPERMATHRRIRDQRQAILALEAKVRGLSAPPTDRIWQRHRNEVDLLAELVRRDVQLVGSARTLGEEAGRMTIDSWDHDAAIAPLSNAVQMIEQVISERMQLLLLAAG